MRRKLAKNGRALSIGNNTHRLGKRPAQSGHSLAMNRETEANLQLSRRRDDSISPSLKAGHAVSLMETSTAYGVYDINLYPRRWSSSVNDCKNGHVVVGRGCWR